MVFKSFSFKIFIFANLMVFTSCSNALKTTEITKQTHSNAAVIQITPTPFQGKAAKIRGEYSPIKITENLKDSVEQQELPKIWLEFEKENGEILKTELDDKFSESLTSAGEALFRYKYLKHQSENTDDIANAAYNHSITFVNSLNKIRKLEINSPDGKRKLTEDEISKVFDKQSGMINDRYFQLDNHFYPKSAFYTFKESVNEKLGYQIF